MKTNTYSIFAADTMEGEYARSAALPLFTAASDTIWSRDVPLVGSLLVRTLDDIVLDMNRQIPGVKNILPDILEIALDNIGDYNLSALKAVLEFDRRTSNPVNVTSAGENLLRINLQGAGISEKDRTLTGNRRIRIQLRNGNMVCRNLKVCCDAKGRPLGHLRGRLLSAPAPVAEYCCQSDNNKNITSLTDDVGAICAAWEYDAYGNIVNQTGEKLEVNPLRFSSEYHDEELGLVYYNYRHYNPKEGRWISRDPMQEQTGGNRYLFASNAPVAVFDSRGLYIIYVGGADESSLVKGKVVSIRMDILEWMQGDRTFSQKHVQPIVDHINEISGKKKFRNKPVIVVGHSYGGDSAYNAVKKIKYPKCACVFLITVDPVSRMKSTSQGKVPYPGNVWFWWNVAQPANFINVLNNVQIGDNIAAQAIGLAATVAGTTLTMVGAMLSLAGGYILMGYGLWKGNGNIIDDAAGKIGNTIAVLGGQWNLNTDANNNIAAKDDKGITIAHGRAREMLKVELGDSAKGTVLENINLYNNMKCKDIRNMIDGVSV